MFPVMVISSHFKLRDQFMWLMRKNLVPSFEKMYILWGLKHQGRSEICVRTEKGFLDNQNFKDYPHALNISFSFCSKSKKIMAEAGVPIIEGYHGEGQDVALLRKEAQRIG